LTTLLDTLTFSQQSEYEKRIAQLETENLNLKKEIFNFTENDENNNELNASKEREKLEKKMMKKQIKFKNQEGMDKNML